LRGKGLPTAGGTRGNLFAIVSISMPPFIYRASPAILFWSIAGTAFVVGDAWQGKDIGSNLPKSKVL